MPYIWHIWIHMEDLLPSSSIHLISLLLKHQDLSKANLPNISHTPHTDKAWCHMIVVWHLSEFGWKMWKCWAKRPWSQLLCEVGDVGVQECSSPVAALQPPVAAHCVAAPHIVSSCPFYIAWLGSLRKKWHRQQNLRDLDTARLHSFYQAARIS